MLHFQYCCGQMTALQSWQHFFFFALFCCLNHGAVSLICHNHNFSNMCSFRNSLKRAAFDLLRWEFCLAGFRSLFRGVWIPPDCYVPFCSLLDSLPPHYLFGALKDASKSVFVLVGIQYIFSSSLLSLPSSPSFSTPAFVISLQREALENRLFDQRYCFFVQLITLQPWSPSSVIGYFLWITWKKWKKILCATNKSETDTSDLSLSGN